MLQLIRDRATGWIAWVIIILICIPFALWGVNSYFEPDQGLVVASVDDSEISYYQYREAVQQQREQLQQMLGGNIGQELLDSPAMREQVLESLIDAEAMLQGAVKSGLRVGDAQVAKTIRSIPVFQDEGQFSSERYTAILRSRGLSTQGFELDLRRSILTEQISAAIQRTAIVTSADIDSSLALRNEQRVIKLLTIDPASLRTQVPDEAAIKAWYDAHIDEYIQPEQVSVRYIELSREEIAKTVTAADDELRAIYEQRMRQGGYGLPEQREARHILIEVASGASNDEVAAARAAIDAARKRIVDGEDFAKVASEVSQDAGSAPLGGQLGQFGRDVMDPQFEDAAFALSANELSEPVRSRFGWHLIEITAIQAAKVRSFEEARAEVLSEYQVAQADEIFAEQAERLASLGFENPESLEVASQALGLPVLHSGFFSLRGEQAEGVAGNPRVRAAAFSSDVLEAGNNSELLELDEERRVILRVAERKAPRQRTLDEVRDVIADVLNSEHATELARTTGERVLDGLRSGSGAATLTSDVVADFVTPEAAQAALQWSESKTLKRGTSTDVPPTVAVQVFSMPPPVGGKARYAGVALQSGGFAIVELTEVSQALLDAEEAKNQRARIERELRASRGEQALSAVQKSLRRRADVVIKQQNLRADES